MLWMRADPLRGQVGGGGALEIKTFWGPVNWHRAVRLLPFGANCLRTVVFAQYLLPFICCYCLLPVYPARYLPPSACCIYIHYLLSIV